LGLKQKRPDKVGAQFATGTLYHGGNAGQMKKYWKKTEEALDSGLDEFIAYDIPQIKCWSLRQIVRILSLRKAPETRR